jgi:hypothetical protein
MIFDIQNKRMDTIAISYEYDYGDLCFPAEHPLFIIGPSVYMVMGFLK